jgi:flagellar motor switch protein FliN/FliY
MWGKYNLRDALSHGRPQFIAQLKINYADGTSQIITSDEKWKTHGGPILRNNIYLGEVYDARKEINGWNTFGFDENVIDRNKTTTESPNIDFLLDIPLTISAELGRTKMIIYELLQLSQGSVIELNKLAGEPLDVRVNDKLIARGEAVVVNEKFGVRITDIVNPQERIENLKGQ